jgi:3-oxosteroid 1-dehydrogenase
MTEATHVTWDDEVDFVSIGSGIGGLSGAIAAHDWGLSALVLEKAPTLGGVTSYSYGELWAGGNHLQLDAGIDDSIERAIAYISRLGMGYADEKLIRNFCVHTPLVLRWFEENAGIKWRIIRGFGDYYYPQDPNAAAEGRFLETEPFPAASLGEWQTRTHTAPQTPTGVTHAEMFLQGGAANMRNWDQELISGRRERDERTLGPGLAAAFVKATIDRGIPLHTSTPAEDLITQDGRVVGLRAVRDGRDWFIRARKGVLVAAGGYDWNEQAHLTYDLVPDIKSATVPSVTGDGIALGAGIGARLAQVPMPTTIGFHLPGEDTNDGRPLWRFGGVELGVPHSIMVNRKGKRFGDESFSRSIAFALKVIDGSTQEQVNYPFWVIQDSQARERYNFGSVPAGAEFPEGFAVQADTLHELAELVGIDPVGLEAEVERFNGFVETGVDEDFARGTKAWSNHNSGDHSYPGNPNLGVVGKPPFYAIRQYPVSIGLSSVGLAADQHSRAQNYKGGAVEGLYVAGNSMAMTDLGAGYTSGQANSRGMVNGWLAARHAAGDPSTELDG